jgi:hypothetical protein
LIVAVLALTAVSPFGWDVSSRVAVLPASKFSAGVEPAAFPVVACSASLGTTSVEE